MLGLLFLLLPVAAAYGWFMGRNSLMKEQEDSKAELSKNYLAGINLLLSQQNDKAVDVFIEMLDVDDDTVETHWTLGNLFRRRGEIERAIRIHTNLTQHPSLNEFQRLQAKLELAKDYLAVGFYDRSENLLLELKEHYAFREESAYLLLDIYEATGEWHLAIKTALKIKKTDINRQNWIAHYYCQLAEHPGIPEQNQKKHYEKALRYDKQHVRASLALAAIARKSKDNTRAIELLLPLLDESKKELIPLVLPELELTYVAMRDKAGLISHLERVIRMWPSSSALILMVKYSIELGQKFEAEKFIRLALHRNPTMRGFQQLIDLHIEHASTTPEKESLIMLRNIVDEYLQRKPDYLCNNCGFEGKTLYWRCPSCEHWETIVPAFGLDGE